MNASQDIRLITDGEAMGKQGRGSQAASRGFARGGKAGGRGSNKNLKCFNCGKEGHFVVACLNKSNLAKEAAEQEVDLISSSETHVFVVTRSTSEKNVVNDSKLNTEGHKKEATNSRDKGKGL